ncbi:MAG: hypothetical protein QG596_816 [Actinomycetota bacterium]|jgi:hypothetical protein|nr:hypothetical protein [Actinomycetota bacterium]
MKRALILTALGLAFSGAFGATQAQADTYCAELPDDVSCTENFTGFSTSIQEAVNAADQNEGPDTVKIGPGVFEMPSPVYLSNSGDGNKLNLTGSGESTVLSGSDPAAPEIHFSGGTGSSINALTVSIPDDASNEYKIGLALDGGATGNGLNVTFASHLVNGEPSPGNRTTGVRLTAGSTLENSTVRLYGSNVNDAVDVYGSGNIVESTLTAFRDVYQRNATGTVEIRRSALVVIGGGVVTEGGTMNIRDSVILNPYFSGNGVYVTSDGGGATNVLIDRSTILGTPTTVPESPTVGAVVLAAAGSPNPGSTSFQLNNSVIYGYDFEIAYTETFPEDTLNIEVDSSAYNSTNVAEYPGQGTPTFNVEGLLELNNVDPMFANPFNGDYSLAAGSPLIDAGQAVDPAPGSLDFAGNPRACDGNDDGTIRRDIGAYEFRADPADDCTYPTATITGPQGDVTGTS